MDTKRAQKKFAMRPAQAFIEMAVGLFALSLVLAALFSFCCYMTKSLTIQRTLRAEVGRTALTHAGDDGASVSQSGHARLTLEPFAADFIFGAREIPIREKIYFPALGGIEK